MDSVRIGWLICPQAPYLVAVVEPVCSAVALGMLRRQIHQVLGVEVVPAVLVLAQAVLEHVD